ncbi:hypothetical protein AAZX31_13G060100 [Glycine max]|uniref:TIR domain-containing protein n=2 Tax=Glycine subgen. Soja TaxID=1462606 RepID=K7LX77_SOYBN|nr:putative disease resistance protein At4g11170 isoform X2 [Glycine max]XP_028195949.1 putative disease resistance protein At4g11170 isoform X3 [Glycine soja]RZB71342.1 TMV resistance protein N isoform C [Glycine soja]|eukprot:XP_006593609.1 putative disease resistance protein At4g11170 isoform X3 [Glycine max]
MKIIMDEQNMIRAVASSSNSSSMVSSKKYDVFLSFRGEDTRKNFTSHLYEALKQKKIETYIDYRLEKGDEISAALIKAIEDSHVSVVIFSENYASSKWCLGELGKIMECKKERGQIVIPVFYNIDPSHVRKQTGSYEQSFAKHTGEPRCSKWKAALTEAANLAAWDSQIYRTESEFLKDIVKDVLRKLAPRYPNHRKELVGVEENYEKIESLLKIGSSKVRILGIWGMGGIGKTTLASALYDKLSPEFEGCCFLANVREESDKHGFKALRNKLFSELLENENLCFDASSFLVSHFVLSRLGRKKVFIVLDDVDTSEQLENLIEDFDFLGLGSRVIVTTRNKQIFSQVDKIYKVKELSIHHSLKLFCLSVFREKQPKHGYEDLSRSAISYCKGIPLALKVLGASLRSRSKQAWECELRKLQKFPNMEIHNVLKLSYDGLDYSQKEIFLDIACFLRGKQRDHVTSILEAFDFPAASGIEVLLDKALITISGGIQIEMHDLIQEMGWKIVHQEHIKDPGRRSRLWKHEEVHDVLKYNKNLVNLKTIDLWGSRDLVEIPDLSKAEKLESVSLCYCESLCQLQVHSKSLGVLNLYGCSSLREFLVTSEELTELNLAFTAICALPSSIWQKRKLRSLYLRGCHNLNKLSDEPRFCGSYKHSITTLASNVKRLPVNIENLSMMTMIWLDDCRKLVSLPELPLFLEKLSACNCTSLDTKITQQQVLQHMLQSRIPYLRKHYLKCYDEEYFFPGDHVIDECRFHTTQNSITIPYLQKPELCGFIYCIILSMGPLLECDVSCSVYQDGIRVGWLERLLEYENLISDHVVILYHDISEFDKISEVHDHFFSNITFIFENNEDRITEFGVFPVYASESGLKLVGSKEIFE